MVTDTPKSGKYFQFPISAFFFGKPVTEVTLDEKSERLHAIIKHCIFEAAKSVDTTNETVLQIAAKELNNQPQFDDDDLNDPKKLALLAAASMLSVQLGSNSLASNSEWITPSVTDKRKKAFIKADRIPRYPEGNAFVRLL